jgi:uncharacterized protein YgiM (DUF1202 family)
MKTLFLIAALAGAVYLIMQTPAGQNWLEESPNEPNVAMQQEIKKLQQTSSQVAKSLENKVTELVNSLDQQQQTHINQLENRIAELENELIMARITESQTPETFQQPIAAPSGQQDNTNNLTQPFVVSEFEQASFTQPAAEQISAKTLQHRRQAKLQDIAEKMQLSSLQALVD